MAEKVDQYDKQVVRSTIQAVLLVVSVVVLWGAFAAAVWCLDEEELFSGTFGDSFGVLTALFSGLALVGLWFTIQLQRIELAATRHVLREQSKSLSQQVFEGTFFQLLARLSTIVETIKAYPGGSGWA